MTVVIVPPPLQAVSSSYTQKAKLGSSISHGQLMLSYLSFQN